MASRCIVGTTAAKIHPARLGFDIDGVVADTMEAFIRLARLDHGVDTIAPSDITDFEVQACLDVDPAVIDTIFGRLLNEPLAAGLRPMGHAIPVLRDFARLAPLTFVTARPDRKPIAAWLRYYLGADAFSKVRLVAMGDHDSKAAYIHDLGLACFIDDRAQTCINLTEDGITAMVYDQPWNRGKHRLATVDNWLTIRRLCL